MDLKILYIIGIVLDCESSNKEIYCLETENPDYAYGWFQDYLK